ncbi:MAG: thioredoxin fold domain-containing protein [Candidatus Omnitrophica bacterium]|nr:thioredoxin fold domain-containing protein [Candidatus Omnitrophota bacterium]
MSKHPFKIIFFFFLIGAVLLPSPAHAALSWRYSLRQALKEAKKTGTPVMIDFYTDWCHWCKKLDQDTYSDAAVKRRAEYFLCVKVDGDKERELVKAYGVRGYPTVLFLNSEGSTIGRIPGYVGPEDFLKVMDDVLKETDGYNKRSPRQKTDADRIPREPSPTGLELSGIMYDPETPVAIINGEFVKEGESIGGATVAEITKNSVRLDRQGKEIILTTD